MGVIASTTLGATTPKRSSSEVQQLFRQRPVFLPVYGSGQNRVDFLTQHLPLQGLTLVRMRRPSRLVIPRTAAAIDQRGLRPLPSPGLHRAVHPAVQVEGAP